MNTQIDRHTDTHTHRHDWKHYLPWGGNYAWTSQKWVLFFQDTEWHVHLLNKSESGDKFPEIVTILLYVGIFTTKYNFLICDYDVQL